MTVVNLNKARKARARTEAEAQAAQNRISFGRTKAEKALTAARNHKLAKDTDAHKRER
jgi:hypothetical protein